MSILKDIPELVKADVISQETANKIRDYYHSRDEQSPNKLLIVYGIFGAILTGLGIILIIAHNWDELSRTSKTFIAFLPLIVGQIFCGFILIKKQDSIAWRESGASFLFFAVAACISLISQIYNIPGDLSAFLLTWMILCFPLIYIMNSSAASLLYIVGITSYACQGGYWTYPYNETYFYWILLLLALPHYYKLYKNSPQSNFIFFHNWVVPLSIIITLGTVVNKNEEFIFIAYISLFGLFYSIGNTTFYKKQKPANSGYLVLGSAGTIALLLALSFDWFWEDLAGKIFQINKMLVSPEFIAALVISLSTAAFFYLQNRNKLLTDIKPVVPVFILFIIIFIIGLSSHLSVILVNLLIFTIGIVTIKNGARQDHLGILNYGLLIITALVICRFFDTELSFVLRGLLFMSVGIGFFVANFWMHKKRKENG